MPKLVTLPRGGLGGFGLDLGDMGDVTGQIVKGATDFYAAQSAVQGAKYGAQLAKANAQAAINIAKAGGQNAAATAGAGLPSPSLLLIGGLGLAALLILKK